MPRANYPATVAEVTGSPVRFKRATVEAVKAFARSKPWRGTPAERASKFQQVHFELCTIYGKRTRLVIPPAALRPDADSTQSFFTPAGDYIALTGLSVVTYLHEFAHAVYGSDERKAVRWSVSLFKLAFPRSYRRCEHVGHTLRRRGGAR